jgi:hypothetical protein
MSKKSAITRLPREQRDFVEKLLREDRLTLNEMVGAIQAKFPDLSLSRSGLHRYQAGFAEMTSRMREIEHVASVLVGELGDGIGEKSGQLLAQAVTTLATDAALRAHGAEEVSIEEVRKLARAAKDVLQTRKISMQERQAIEAAAREKLIAEQKVALEQMTKSAGLSADTANMLRRQLLGIHT